MVCNRRCKVFWTNCNICTYSVYEVDVRLSGGRRTVSEKRNPDINYCGRVHAFGNQSHSYKEGHPNALVFTSEPVSLTLPSFLCQPPHFPKQVFLKYGTPLASHRHHSSLQPLRHRYPHAPASCSRSSFRSACSRGRSTWWRMGRS